MQVLSLIDEALEKLEDGNYIGCGNTLKKLKDEIKRNIDCRQDKICIYILGSLKYIKKEEIGCINEQDNFI